MLRRVLLPSFVFLSAAIIAAGFSPAQTQSSPTGSPIPHIEKQNGHYALMVDGVPYLMLGAQINNSSAWPAMLQQVWPAIDDLHANTVEMPILEVTFSNPLLTAFR